MIKLRTSVRLMGAGLIVAGVFCSVIYGFNVLYLILAVAGVVIFGLGSLLLSHYLPGSKDLRAQPRARWDRKPDARKEPTSAPVGSVEKVAQDLEDSGPQKTSVKTLSWLRKGDGRRWIPHLCKAGRVWRIPGFRQFKRLSAFVCMILNFIFGEFALTAPGNAAFSIFFLVSSFLLADYLWKTRHKPGETPE